jgi:hypothetical protein
MTRVTVAVCAAMAILSCGPAVATPWRPDVRSARVYAHARLGTVSFAVRTERRLWGVDVHRTVPTASVVKAMLLVAYLRRPELRARRMRPADRALLAPMVRWSDDVAATRVRDIVGNGALVRLAHVAAMRSFVPAPLWGVSRIDAADGARFFLRLPRLVPRRHRDAALRLLRSIVPSQRWGIGRERPPGWALYFKGGWGSGSGAVDHQVALLRRGRRRVSAAILTTGSPSHAYATRTLRGVAARLLRHLRPSSLLQRRLRAHGPHPLALRAGVSRRAAGVARREPPG